MGCDKGSKRDVLIRQTPQGDDVVIRVILGIMGCDKGVDYGDYRVWPVFFSKK
jgi:hypothetical protein